jgi:choline dehydrogenase
VTSYDYIVVGAGSAGCAVAARLSESGRHTVLLLEAGGAGRQLWLHVPIGYGKSFYDPRVNWMYRTVPEDALDGRAGYWPRGKVLGGSSAINAMVYVRGQRADFEAWRAHGNPGWDWPGVLPYFKKMEDDQGGPSEWRGAGGPVSVADVAADCHRLCEAFLQACGEAGFRRTPDFNGAQPEGVGYYQITTRGGVRVSAARAYLWPAAKRPNLRVATQAQATRILFEGTRATGLQYRQGGVSKTAQARGEIILSAGSIGSPQLLQLSGVGPEDLLAALGIGIVRGNPAVGANLQDHLCIDHLYRCRLPTLNQTLGSWRGRIQAALQYGLHQRGPLSVSVNQAGGFVRSQPGLPGPDLQIYFSPLSYTRAVPGVRALMRPDPFPGFLLSAQPCRPASRGAVRVTTADPFAAPLITPHSLSAAQDIADLLRGAKLLRRLAGSPALAAIIAAELQPGPAIQSDDALIADIRRRASTVFHPVGTCRMGPDAAADVVDPALRVHGLQGLRVIDASIFPTVTSGNTNAPAIMVGEKGADLVLRDAAG